MDFFISDTHFFHRNILKLGRGRPFSSTEEMNERIVQNWNATIKAEDTVYHLGDVAFGKFEDAKEIVQKLNGRKILIKGNHDRSANRMIEMGFVECHNSFVIEAECGKLYLSHKPLVESETLKIFDCRFNFHGHIHELWNKRGVLYNVGVDVRDFTPRTAEFIYNNNPEVF